MLARAPPTKSVSELKRIVEPIAKQYGISHVVLFGSRSRGDYSKDSDYDFLIDVHPGTGLIQIGCFLEDLEAALGTPVSIVDETMISDMFRRSIAPDMREIYG